MLQIKCYVFLKYCQEPRDQDLEKEEFPGAGQEELGSVM